MRRRFRLAPPALALALALAAASARGAPGGARIGVLASSDEEAAETAAALVATWNAAAAGAEGDFVQRVVGRDEKDTAGALEDLHRENVRLVVAVGDAATARVRDAVRDVDVVFATPDAALAAELRRGGGACVATGAGVDVVAANLRRAVPRLKRVAVYVPNGDEAAATNARELAAEFDVVVADAAGASADARATSAAAKLRQGIDAVWLPPSVAADDALAVAQAMAGGGRPLVGSRKSHLAAGCAVVVRVDPTDLGGLAAVLARRVLDGADPGKTPTRTARRSVVEVNLPAAERIGFSAPLTLLAWADAVWPRAGKARR